MNAQFRQVSPRLWSLAEQDPELILAILARRDAPEGTQAATPAPKQRGRQRSVFAKLPWYFRLMLWLGGHKTQFEIPVSRDGGGLAFSEAAALESMFGPQIARGRQVFEKHGIGSADLVSEISIDKAWHGLHYLLCESPDVSADSLSQVVLGGRELGDDLGYGPARIHIPSEVASLSALLSALDENALRRRYRPRAMRQAEIYPGSWDNREDLQWLLDSFETTRDYFADAARRGNAVLAYLS